MWLGGSSTKGRALGLAPRAALCLQLPRIPWDGGSALLGMWRAPRKTLLSAPDAVSRQHLPSSHHLIFISLLVSVNL